jgi:hypothetical protein
MAGTGSYYILCIEYTLHYNVTSLGIVASTYTVQYSYMNLRDLFLYNDLFRIRV